MHQRMTVKPPPPADYFAPRFPQKLEELDVNTAFLTDLALKTMAVDAECTTASIAGRLRLGMIITDTLLKRLYNERFIETKGVIGLHNHQYAMLDRGWERNRCADMIMCRP